MSYLALQSMWCSLRRLCKIKYNSRIFRLFKYTKCIFRDILSDFRGVVVYICLRMTKEREKKSNIYYLHSYIHKGLQARYYIW